MRHFFYILYWQTTVFGEILFSQYIGLLVFFSVVGLNFLIWVRIYVEIPFFLKQKLKEFTILAFLNLLPSRCHNFLYKLFKVNFCVWGNLECSETICLQKSFFDEHLFFNNCFFLLANGHCHFSSKNGQGCCLFWCWSLKVARDRFGNGKAYPCLSFDPYPKTWWGSCFNGQCLLKVQTSLNLLVCNGQWFVWSCLYWKDSNKPLVW